MGLSNKLYLRLSKVESYVMVLNVVTLVYLPYKNAGCNSRSDSFISIVTTNIAQSKYTTFTVIVAKPIWQLLVSNSNTSNMIGSMCYGIKKQIEPFFIHTRILDILIHVQSIYANMFCLFLPCFWRWSTDCEYY